MCCKYLRNESSDIHEILCGRSIKTQISLQQMKECLCSCNFRHKDKNHKLIKEFINSSIAVGKGERTTGLNKESKKRTVLVKSGFLTKDVTRGEMRTKSKETRKEDES